MASTTENPNEETIKCVVVGDNNVGKTKLVCARAYSHHRRGHHYMKPGGHHIPTVWANDHYRNEIDVLNNARDCIDGVNVSLRLWDTFGDHNKNRRFSYGRADVVLVCFSIVDSKSLDHVSSFWLPELRHHCKSVPVLLVGCKVDIRFANLDDLNKHRTSLVRKIQPGDILYPEICRQTAGELSLPYYETSTCTGFGIKEVFENAVRAALVYKRKTYLYRNTALKHVQKPLLQEPLIPTKPTPPSFVLEEAVKELDFGDLYDDATFSDLIVTCHGLKFSTHKAVLASASKVFHSVFMSFSQKYEHPCKVEMLAADKENLNENVIRGNEVIVLDMKNVSKECGRQEGSLKDVPDLLSVNNNSNASDTATMSRVVDFNNGKSLQSGDVAFDFLSCYLKGDENERDVLHLNSDISEFAFKNIMYFCYTGHLASEIASANWLKQNIQHFTDLFVTSQRFGLRDLANLLTELLNEGAASAPKSLRSFASTRTNCIRNTILWRETYSDTVFHVDDGYVPGHKPFLVCGSDMMSAMFGGTFIESANKEVRLPGTTVSSLQIVFEYIYTKETPSFSQFDVEYCDLIELVNRLCLTELMCLLERHVIEKYTDLLTSDHRSYVYEEVIQLLEVAQLHNASNLAAWCAYCIATNYNDFCRKCKLMKTLSPDNQTLLERSRWPPVWFIKDFDNYERACKKRTQEESERRKSYKRQ